MARSEDLPPESSQNIIQLEVIDVTADVPTIQATAASATLLLNQSVQQPANTAPAIQVAQARDGPWTMRDLEPILGSYLGNFTHYFIPKLINLTGNHARAPWSLHSLDLKGAMENLAAEVWPMLTIEVIPHQPFFDMVSA